MFAWLTRHHWYKKKVLDQRLSRPCQTLRDDATPHSRSSVWPFSTIATLGPSLHLPAYRYVPDPHSCAHPPAFHYVPDPLSCAHSPACRADWLIITWAQPYFGQPSPILSGIHHRNFPVSITFTSPYPRIQPPWSVTWLTILDSGHKCKTSYLGHHPHYFLKIVLLFHHHVCQSSAATREAKCTGRQLCAYYCSRGVHLHRVNSLSHI